MGKGNWQAAVHSATKNQTQLNTHRAMPYLQGWYITNEMMHICSRKDCEGGDIEYLEWSLTLKPFKLGEYDMKDDFYGPLHSPGQVPPQMLFDSLDPSKRSNSRPDLEIKIKTLISKGMTG